MQSQQVIEAWLHLQIAKKQKGGEHQMSVRAYKIITKQYEDCPTFNLWHDKELMRWLIKNTSFYSQLSDDGVGEADIDVKDIKTIISIAKDLNLDEESVDQFRRDIESLEDNDFVTYHCF